MDELLHQILSSQQEQIAGHPGHPETFILEKNICSVWSNPSLNLDKYNVQFEQINSIRGYRRMSSQSKHWHVNKR